MIFTWSVSPNIPTWSYCDLEVDLNMVIAALTRYLLEQEAYRASTL